MLNTFFDTGQVDASLYTYQPLDFDVGLGWPALAKLLLAVVVLVLILLLVLVWLITRWVKRRRASQTSGRQTLDPAPEVRLPRDAGHASFVELPVVSGELVNNDGQTDRTDVGDNR